MRNLGLSSLVLVSLAIVSLASSYGSAATVDVASYTELTNAITAASDGDTLNVTRDITVSAQVTITKALTIEGNGHTISVPVPGLDASGIYNTNPSTWRVFNVNASGKTITLNNMIVKGGRSASMGAGIFNNPGTILKLNGVTISNCLCQQGGGGLVNSGGTVYLKDSSISRNAADHGGGFLNVGNGAMMFIENSTFSENRSTSGGGGGGAGENQKLLYINNSTFANNKSTELGGAFNNYGGTMTVTNCTFTGNVAYGSYAGGAIALHNGGIVKVANSLFAYNYKNTGTAIAPVYALSDIYLFDTSTKADAYFCFFQAPDNASVTFEPSNSNYAGADDGSDNDLFTGGSYTPILGPDGTVLGTNKVFQPFLIKAGGASVPTATLKGGIPVSSALGAGTKTGFTNGNGTPTVGYYDAATWQTFVGSNPENYQVTTDQNNAARPVIPAVGAVETIVSNVCMLKVNAATGGTVNGGTVYGDVYAAGSNVTLTGIANSGYAFTRWDYVLGGAGTASTANPYTLTLNADTTLVPVFSVQAAGYTITYVGNGNTGGTVPAVQTSAGGATTISGPGSLEKTGYAFSGWNTSDNGSGTSYNPGDTYTSVNTNLTLYAQYVSAVSITASAGAHGSISPAGATLVAVGGSRQYTITPDISYRIADVLVDGVSVGAVAQYTFSNASANHTISASFAVAYSTANASIAGVKIESGDAIAPRPTIAVTLEGSGTFASISSVEVDGAAAPFTAGPNGGTNSGSFSLQNPLAPGLHTIKIIALDTLGRQYLIERRNLAVSGGNIASSGPTLVYPNPYDPLAGNMKITYYLASDTGVKLYVFDTAGRMVWRQEYSGGENGGKAGYNEISWDGYGLFGNLASDAYMVKVVNASSGSVITKTKFLVWKGGVK